MIGNNIHVIDSNNHCNIGIFGKVIDETKNTLTIQTKKGNKKMIKRQNIFKITKKQESFKIDGKSIEKRPYE